MNSLSTTCHSNINKVLSHWGPVIMYINFTDKEGCQRLSLKGYVNAVACFISPNNLRYEAFNFNTQKVHHNIFAYILQQCRLYSGKRLLMTHKKSPCSWACLFLCQKHRWPVSLFETRGNWSRCKLAGWLVSPLLLVAVKTIYLESKQGHDSCLPPSACLLAYLLVLYNCSQRIVVCGARVLIMEPNICN